MKITMLSTQQGSEDGFRIKEYVEGCDYALGSTIGQLDLARAFIGASMAVEKVPDDGAGDAPPASVKKTKAPK